MREERGTIQGDLDVTEDLDLRGPVTGSVRVTNRATLRLHGLINGDLSVAEDCRVELHGMVIGDVTNDGGMVRVLGMVEGRLRHRRGETLVHEDSIVRGDFEGSIAPLPQDA